MKSILSTLIISFYLSDCVLVNAQNLDSFGASKIGSEKELRFNEFLTLTSSNGDEISAKILEVHINEVMVQLRDGRKLEIPIQNLSKSDQELIMKYQHKVEIVEKVDFYEDRVWQSKNGKVLIGKIHRAESNTVFIKRNDGRIVPLPHKILSDKDMKVLKIYASKENLMSNEDIEYLLGLYKWKDRTDRNWQIQLEFEQTPSSDGRKVLSIVHRSHGSINKVKGSWALENNGILFTSAGNGGNDVRWKCPNSKKSRKAIVSEIRGLFNYFGFCMASNLVLVPDN